MGMRCWSITAVHDRPCSSCFLVLFVDK
jgi:hypothetical protein